MPGAAVILQPQTPVIFHFDTPVICDNQESRIGESY
jgi:hypothetical protein